ncbi:hypothetical protein DFH29DRAFT_970337 [Suillus ampliporus]|nr:hypothetical protein DFH29DRAFT_970337 [Suillus ampliporus]
MSSSSQDLTPQLDLGSTFGALLIGVIIAAVLVGVTNIQAFVYFQMHSNTGRTFYKLVVHLLTFDVLHLALIIHCVYYYLVNNYANIGALTKVVWSFKAPVIYGVHLLYVYHIWIALPITIGIIVILCAEFNDTLCWLII